MVNRIQALVLLIILAVGCTPIGIFEMTAQGASSFHLTVAWYSPPQSQGIDSVVIYPMKSSYSYGDIVTITAIPSPVSFIATWQGNVPSGMEHSNPITIRVMGNTFIEAIFNVKNPAVDKTLTILRASNGHAVPPMDTYWFLMGVKTTITAYPNTGYYLKYWVLDGKRVYAGATITLTMTSNHVLQPVFAHR